MTHIARRECCCRAYKCNRIPNYGLPPHADSRTPSSAQDEDDDDAVRTNTPGSGHGHGHHRQRGRAPPDSPGDGRNASEVLQSGPTTGALGYTVDPSSETADPVSTKWLEEDDATEKPCGDFNAKKRGNWQRDEADMSDRRISCCEAGPQREEEQQGGGPRGAAGSGSAGATRKGGDGAKPSTQRMGRASASQGRGRGGRDRADETLKGDGQEDDAPNEGDLEVDFMEEGKNSGGGEEPRSGEKTTVGLSLAGRAIACREHALEGMVYLGQRYQQLYAGCHKYQMKERSIIMLGLSSEKLEIPPIRKSP